VENEPRQFVDSEILHFDLVTWEKRFHPIYLSIPFYNTTHTHTYRVSQEEGTKLREIVPYIKIYRYNPKHLYPKLNGYGDNGQRSLKL